MNPLRANPRLLAPILAGLSMIGPFSIDTFFPAFHAMEGEFGVTPAQMQLSISVYLMSYALMALLHGPISDSYGRRGVIIVMMTAYVGASVGAAMSPSFTWLLSFRALQGFSSGAGTIVGRAIVRDRFHGAEAQRLMAQVSMIFGVAPALAPIFGGWLFDFAGWRSIFWAIAAFGLLLIATSIVALPETHPRSVRQPLSLSSLISTYAMIFRDRQFMYLAGASTFIMGGLFLYIASAPVIVLDLLKMSERQFGWLFVPLISGLTFGSILSGRLAGRLDRMASIRLAATIALISIVANLAVSYLLPPSAPWSVLPISLYAVGMGLSLPTLTLMMLDRFPLARGAAASLQSALMLMFNAMSSWLISPLLSHSLLRLAVGVAVVGSLAYICWRLYLAVMAKQLPEDTAAVSGAAQAL